jgi:hypothetical protein
MAWQLRMRVYGATIVPKGGTTGSVEHSNPLRGIQLEWDDSDRARMRAERAIMVCLAGPAAQRQYNPRGWRRYHGTADYERATDLALRLWGTGAQASLYLRLLDNAVTGKIALWWPSIEALAATLLGERSLDRSRVLDICVR